MPRASVARRLGLSVRELRRRLKVEGVHLPHLLVEARLRIAKRKLGRPGVSSKEAAYARQASQRRKPPTQPNAPLG